MGGQAIPPAGGRGVIVVVAALWLAFACNQLTGVGDLKVSRCSADAGADAGECETGLESLRELDAGVPVERCDSELGNCSVGRGTAEGRGREGEGGQGSGGSGNAARGGDDGAPDNGGTEGSISSLAPVVGAVGAACAGDADCSSGLGCTTSQATSGPFASAGPQGGFCSRPCAGDDDCVSSDPNSLCVSHAGGPAFCFPECAPRVRSFPDQCNGRSDLLCLPLSGSQGGYCAPACQSDADCAPRACDLATGLCTENATGGEAVGAACSADEECAAGLCLSLAGQPAACTGLCTLGITAGCGFGEEDSSRSAACTGSPSGSFGPGLGVGLCQELCNVDEDCLQAESGWSCTPWPSAADEERFGSTGFCEAAASASGSPGCNDSCLFAGNGTCDDDASFLPLCDPGTDCTDCGPRG